MGEGVFIQVVQTVGIDCGERGASGKDGAQRDPAGTGSVTEPSHGILCRACLCIVTVWHRRQECVVGASM